VKIVTHILFFHLFFCFLKSTEHWKLLNYFVLTALKYGMYVNIIETYISTTLMTDMRAISNFPLLQIVLEWTILYVSYDVHE